MTVTDAVENEPTQDRAFIANQVDIVPLIPLLSEDSHTLLSVADGRLRMSVEADGEMTIAFIHEDGCWHQLPREVSDRDSDDEVPFWEPLVPPRMRDTDLQDDDSVDLLVEGVFSSHLYLIEMYSTLVAAGWRVTIRHQAETSRVRLIAKPPSTEERHRDAEATEALGIPKDLAEVSLNWVLQTTDGDDAWSFESNQAEATGLSGGSTAVPAEAIRIYAIATAPAWTLDPVVDRTVKRHSAGSPMPSSALTSAPEPSTVDAEEARRHRDAIARWGNERGFGPAIAPAMPKAVQTALDELKQGNMGYYLLEFTNADCYIGQSISIAKRLGGHRTLRKDISSIRLLPDEAARNLINPLRHLLDREADLISRAQEAKLPARNKAQMTYISTPRPLDDVFVANGYTVAEWLDDPATVNTSCLTGERSFAPTSEKVAGGKAAYSTWLKRTGVEAPQALAVLRTYIQRCLPLARQTEFDYWVLSSPEAIPKFGTLSNLTIGWTEAFRLNYHKNGPVSGWIQANSVELFGEDPSDRPLVRFQRQHPGVEVLAAPYEAAGPFNVNIFAPTLNILADLLDDTAVTRAGATAALHLMRKSKTGAIRAAHNPVLVDAVLGGG